MTKILGSLSANYFAKYESGGFLNQGCYHKLVNLGVDESLIWGDYYFVEAIIKTLGKMA